MIEELKNLQPMPIPFESFKTMVEAIISMEAEKRALEKALSPFMDSHCILKIGSQQTQAIIRELELLVKGKISMFEGREWLDIEWWLYETDRGKHHNIVGYPDGSEVRIDDIEALYEFMTENWL